ncbi:MAG: hypothetical protein ACK5RJ_01060 [Burkholderiales bacterium]
MSEKISTAFLQRAAEVLSEGLSGSQIVSVTSAFAVDFDRDIPHAVYPFNAGNKKTALFENLQAFSPGQQYQVIYELCDRVSTNPNVTSQQKINASQLKLTLLSRYYQFSSDTSSNKAVPLVVTEVRHWLSDFPAAKKTYEEALQKHSNGIFTRNALDDLRLSLEALLRQLLTNEKSLENQIPVVGAYIKDNGGSSELANMLVKLIDYYTKYQNTYVKHGDAVPTAEAEFVLEITACFMKHLIRIKGTSES